MKRRKTLQELTLKDNFLFGAVMVDPENCRLLLSGWPYDELPDSYVIFICDYDPLGYGKYRYSIEGRCMEIENEIFRDGQHTILLNTKGKNPQDVPEELVRFLRYIDADPTDSFVVPEDSYIKRLQNCILDIKSSREMGERYMTLQELLDKERGEGREEGLKEGREEGLKEGHREGFEEGRTSAIVALLEKGTTAEEVKRLLGASAEEMERAKGRQK